MPQLQVLPYVPSFGEKLTDTIGKAVGEVGEAHYKAKNKKAEEAKEAKKASEFQEILADPNKTYMQKIAGFYKLSPAQQKASQSLIGKILAPEAERQAYFGQVRGENNTAPNEQGQMNAPSDVGQDIQGNESVSQSQKKQSIIDELENMDERELQKYVGVKGPIGEYAKVRLEETRETNKIGREEKLAFHKETQGYDEELRKKTASARATITSLDDIEKALKSGKVKPSSMANILKGFGKIGNKLSEAFLNGDQAAIIASIPQLLEGWKEVFGVRLTDADLALLQDKLPSIGKSEEANRSVINVMRKYAKKTLLREKIARDIKRENGNYRPAGYADLIEDRYEAMNAPVKIINPNNGKVIEIPAYELDAALSKGAKLAQ